MFEDILSSSAGESETENEFKINEKFAKKFEYNKKREEKQKLEEKYKNDDDSQEDSQEDSEEDEIEDEIGQLITPEIDAQIIKTIAMLQKKDDSLYDSNQSYFNDLDLEKAKKEWIEKASKASKPILLKDYQRNRLLESSENTLDHSQVDDPTFVEEQKALKDEFKSALKQDDEGDLFTVRAVDQDETQQEQGKYSEFLLSQMDQESREKWEKIKEKKLDDKNDEEFLMQFVLSRGWIDPKENKIPTYNEITLHDSTDEEELEKMEDFEAKYNFRFEEGGSEHIVTHARTIPGVIRRKDNSRILKRASEIEQKKQRKLQKQEELKRLKNLKREELAEKLKKIQEMAGGDLIGLNEMDLDGDFDPAQYDQKMHDIFADDYYSVNDVKNGKVKKPKWDNDIDISDIVPDAEKSSGFKQSEKEASKMDDQKYHDDDQYQNHDGAKSIAKSQIDKYLDEYYQLDYEDMVGDMPVRFKYRQVEPEDFSLKVEEIILADDKDLNTVVSLKKLGPYRTGQVKEKDNHKWKLTKKKKLWEFRAKLKGKSVAEKTDESHEEERSSKKLRKEAKIDAERLASYSATSSKRK